MHTPRQRLFLSKKYLNPKGNASAHRCMPAVRNFVPQIKRIPADIFETRPPRNWRRLTFPPAYLCTSFLRVCVCVCVHIGTEVPGLQRMSLCIICCCQVLLLYRAPLHLRKEPQQKIRGLWGFCCFACPKRPTPQFKGRFLTLPCMLASRSCAALFRKGLVADGARGRGL